MRNWDFAKVKDGKIVIEDWLTGIIGLMDGGYVYSTLFKYPENGPKRYELVLSMYPQENFRNLSSITMYMEDVPGSSVQSSKFLGDRGINVLNSISMNGISDTTIVWTLMGELNFAGEGDLIIEEFERLKLGGHPSVSHIKHIDITPANLGRIFKNPSKEKVKEEVRHGAPVVFKDGSFNLMDEYSDVLADVEGEKVLITVNSSLWLISVVFFKIGTKLVNVNMNIPDCPKSIEKALGFFADHNINLISIFSKVVIAYQIMSLELVMDMRNSLIALDCIESRLPEHLSAQNGIFELVKVESLN